MFEEILYYIPMKTSLYLGAVTTKISENDLKVTILMSSEMLRHVCLRSRNLYRYKQVRLTSSQK